MKVQKVYTQKVCRKYGVNIWMTKKLKVKKGKRTKKRAFPQMAFAARLSRFGHNLDYCRLLSHLYGGCSRRYIKNTLATLAKSTKALKTVAPGPRQQAPKENLETRLLIHLEQRIDVLLYRLNVCSSIAEARQLIALNTVFINTRCVTTGQSIVQVGDIITLHEKVLHQVQLRMYQNFLENRYQSHFPGHIHACFTTMTFICLAPPKKVSFAEFNFFPVERSITNKRQQKGRFK